MKIFGREPALWIGFIAGAIMVLGTLGFKWLTGDQAGLLIVMINAIAGAVTAFAVRPITPAAFTYAVGAVVAFAGSYGFNIPVETVAAINGLVIAALVLITRDQVSPVETPVNSA